jgi:hypothetical protein
MDSLFKNSFITAAGAAAVDTAPDRATTGTAAAGIHTTDTASARTDTFLYRGYYSSRGR